MNTPPSWDTLYNSYTLFANIIKGWCWFGAPVTRQGIYSTVYKKNTGTDPSGTKYNKIIK